MHTVKKITIQIKCTSLIVNKEISFQTSSHNIKKKEINQLKRNNKRQAPGVCL